MIRRLYCMHKQLFWVVTMGFPSPAQDYVERSLSLDDLCVGRPAATFFMRTRHGAPRTGILAGALLVIDRSLKPAHGSIVIVEFAGDLVICRYMVSPRRRFENLELPGQTIPIPDDDDVDGLQCWGVVTYVINDLKAGEIDDCPAI